MTLTEAEKQTNIKAESLKKRLQRGSLKGLKVGKVWLVFKKDI